jgi:phage internal scaffolding protein
MARKIYERVQTHFTEPSLTRQEFKDECDLGLTLRRFGKTIDGRRALQNAQGFAEGLHFDDVSHITDFRSAQDAIIAGKAAFMQLPAMLRRRFDNDPAYFLDFVTNPQNLDECRALGLVKSVENISSEAPKVEQKAAISDANLGV